MRTTTTATNAVAAITRILKGLLLPAAPPIETGADLSASVIVADWLSSPSAERFPYDAVLQEFHQTGKHCVSTALLDVLSAVRNRLPEVNGTVESKETLSKFLDAALDKRDGRFANPTYLALRLLPLPDVDDLDQDMTVVERRYDRLYVQLIADALHFEIVSSMGQSDLLPQLRPDARTVAKRCRIGLQAITPAARRLGMTDIEIRGNPVQQSGRLWENLAAGMTSNEHRTLQLTAIPVSLIHDEYQFIRVLQSYEATFALVAVELREAVSTLAGGDVKTATQRVDGAEAILREAAPLFSLVATMQIEAFQRFRVYTEGASAIQSRNHKLVESLCRQPDPKRLDSIAFHSVPEVRERVRSGQVTLDDALESARAAGRLSGPDAAGLEQAMLRFAATLKRWRRTHYRLAVRMLGERTGTGYTEGTPYLMAVQEIPVFTTLTETIDSTARDVKDGSSLSPAVELEEGRGAAPSGRCPFSSLARSDIESGRFDWSAPSTTTRTHHSTIASPHVSSTDVGDHLVQVERPAQIPRRFATQHPADGRRMVTIERTSA